MMTSSISVYDMASYTQPHSGPVFTDSTNFTFTVYIRQIQPIHIFIRPFTQIKIIITYKLRYLSSK